MNLSVLNTISKKEIDTFIDSFVQKYSDGYQMFVEQNAKGLGASEDFNVLGWMYYEGIYESEEEILEATAYILGRALVRYANFEWSELNITSSTIIGVAEKESKYFIPLVEFVLLKIYQLTNADNYSTDDLFFDAIYYLDYNQRNISVHPLFALEYNEEYQIELNLNIPLDIKPTINRFWDRDSELFIRTLGLEFYEEYYGEEWEKIEAKFKNIDLEFSKRYYRNEQWKPIYTSTERMIELIDLDDQ